MPTQAPSIPQPVLDYFQRGFRSNALLDSIRPKVNLKQRWALSMEDLELMFGGAAGGSKSDYLLMAGLQYIDISGYAAVIFRRKYTDLALPGALMDRASQLLTGSVMQKLDGGKKWIHPNGGILQFGYLDAPDDKYRYQSAEFQFVGFDELTQIPEDDYRYLFSRIRRPSDTSQFRDLSQVPLRMRSATNPGGVHGEWVKHTFITRKYLRATEEEQFSKIWVKLGFCMMCSGKRKIEIDHVEQKCPVCLGSGKSKRIFVPARRQDNEFLDQISYMQSLSLLPPEERAALEHGRWDIVSSGILFQANWRRNYRYAGVGSSDMLVLPKGNLPPEMVDRNHYWVMITADTASKIKTLNDYTVFSAWLVCEPSWSICWLDTIREKMLIPNILPRLKDFYRQYNARFVIIEDASSGTGIIQEIQNNNRGLGLTVIPYPPGLIDKVSRSHDAQILMQTGRVYFPENLTPLQQDCFNELLLFGHKDGWAHDDFVDTFSMAAWYVAGQWRNQSGVHPPAHIVRKPITHPKYNRY